MNPLQAQLCHATCPPGTDNRTVVARVLFKSAEPMPLWQGFCNNAVVARVLKSSQAYAVVSMYLFFANKITFSPISSLFRQVGSLFRQPPTQDGPAPPAMVPRLQRAPLLEIRPAKARNALIKLVIFSPGGLSFSPSGVFCWPTLTSYPILHLALHRYQ